MALFSHYSNNWNNSPALVANLWDVTDRGINMFIQELFQKWNLKLDAVEDSDNISLVEAASIAREKCEFKYLIGAAVVIYGVPCYLEWIFCI